MAPLEFSSKARKSASRTPRGGGALGLIGGLFSAVNIPLLLCVAILVALGLVTLYSVTIVDTDWNFNKQLLGIALGVALMIVFWLFDYRMLQRLSIPLMVLAIILIILPYIPGLGVEANGATSWIQVGPLTFQPSELAKPIIILSLSGFVSRFEGSIQSGRDYLVCLAMLVVPFVLCAKEDLGTGLVILIIGLVIFFVGGVARRWVLVTFMVLAVGIAALLTFNGIISDYTNGDVKLIKDYQMSRLLVFVDQDNPDYADDAYNLKQAEIAVGSGEVTGKGWGNATQSSGGFLPEAATDFIFCVYAEQFGFVGSAFLIFMYLALLAVALSIGLRAGNFMGSNIAAGIIGLWLFQILENIGMDIGLMPITGIPLPFMSYGSSFMMTNFICVGLLMSVWMRHGQPLSQSKKRKGSRLDV